MINFKELIKERDLAKKRFDKIADKIENSMTVKTELSESILKEYTLADNYYTSLVVRIGEALTDEDVAVPVTVVNFGPEDFNEYKEENLGDIPFNTADIFKAIAGVEVSEESDKVDEEQCGCKDCTSEDDDTAENMTDTIVKAFLLKGLMDALNAIEAKKEGK